MLTTVTIATEISNNKLKNMIIGLEAGSIVQDRVVLGTR